ncbi:MAG: hypothetical protein WC750_02205 [Patescibacteria group bacterium]|jgi:hypothetical protein
MSKVVKFLDKLEDRVRATLSRRPIIYAFIGGTSIVLFWRGVWMVADSLTFLTGPVSIFISVAILLMTGLFVSFFIGDTILISGLKREKRVDEKVVSELKSELEILTNLQNRFGHIEKDLKKLKREIKNLPRNHGE